MKNPGTGNSTYKAVALFIFILLMFATAGTASAGTTGGTTFYVNSTSDTVDANPGNGTCADSYDNCTLRAAVMEANALSGTDTINIPSDTYELTLSDSPGDDTEEVLDLDISEAVNIIGAGATNTIITIDGNSLGGYDRIFEITCDNVTIKKLTVTGGYASSHTLFANPYGSGIMSYGSLTLEDVVIDGNGPSYGTGNYGGGICSAHHPTLNSLNTSLSLNRVTISNNNGGRGGGIYMEGSYLEMTDSTISGNEDGDAGDDGPGIYAEDSAFDIGNSTISGNDGGAAIYNDSDTYFSFIYDTTITGTIYGGGVANVAGYLDISTSIIAGNCIGYSQCSDVGSAENRLSSGGHNIIGHGGAHDFEWDDTDLVGTSNDPADPQLDSLADNGGPTQTHALLSTSPAIDARTDTNSGTDQRGAVRPVDGDGDSSAYWDIGAYEYGGFGILTFSSATYSEDENVTSVTITVERNGNSEGAVSVDYATSNGTAGSEDYTSASGTLEWADGNSDDKTFTVSLTDDDSLEDDETITLTLSGVTGGADLGTNSATLTIVDDEEPEPGTIAFTSSSFSVDEDGTSKTVTVSRTGGSDGAVSVDYATSNGTAVSGSDYTSASGTIDWSDGDSEDKSFAVSITDDSVEEGDETINLALSNPTGGASLGTIDSATLTITDDDEAGTLSFSSSTYSVSEDGTSTTVTVSRTGGSDGAVSVDYATSDGTAGSGDYTSASGTLNWSNGDTNSKTFTVSITDDDTYEGDETVSLSLSSATGGASLGTSSATLTIEDDEEAAPGTLSFSSSTYSISEDGTSKTVTVSRTGGSDGAVSVDYSTSDGTAGSEDYTSTSGTLNWSDCDSESKTFTVSITDDDEYEGDETVSLSLSSATGGASLGTSSATLTIEDNEEAAPGTLSFSSSTYSVSEDGTSKTVTVSRTGGSDGAVSVDYATSDGTAGSGDYRSASGTLNWSDGDSEDKSFTVSIIDDDSLEDDETITLTLSNAAGGASLGTGSATLTIVDDEEETAPGTLSFSSSTYSVNEDGTSGTITVSRTDGNDGAVSVDYSTSDGTAGSEDYTSASGTLNWSDGDSEDKSFIVSITDDDSIEDDETVMLTLSNATGGASLGTGSATLTIVEDDEEETAFLPFLNLLLDE